MLIIKRNLFTGKLVSRELPVTEEQMKAYEDGALVQNAFPQLNASEREFIMTGLSDEQWDSLEDSDDDQYEEEEDEEEDEDI